MSNVSFKSFRATEIEFVNKHDNGTRIEFETTYTYNVKYNQNNLCMGEFTVEVFDKNNKEKFRIKSVMCGIFSYKPDVKKEFLHVETFKEMFPYARAMISNLTVNAGLPPVIIPQFDIESQSIYKFGKNC